MSKRTKIDPEALEALRRSGSRHEYKAALAMQKSLKRDWVALRRASK